jgi:hypothetical protein
MTNLELGIVAVGFAGVIALTYALGRRARVPAPRGEEGSAEKAVEGQDELGITKVAAKFDLDAAMARAKAAPAKEPAEPVAGAGKRARNE